MECFGIFWNILEYFGIFWNVLECSRIVWNILECFWNILEYCGMFWNILDYFGIFWNILEYFGIFWNKTEKCQSLKFWIKLYIQFSATIYLAQTKKLCMYSCPSRSKTFALHVQTSMRLLKNSVCKRRGMLHKSMQIFSIFWNIPEYSHCKKKKKKKNPERYCSFVCVKTKEMFKVLLRSWFRHWETWERIMSRNSFN